MAKLEKVRAANRKADKAIEPAINWVKDSPYTVVILIIVAFGLIGLGAFLAW